MQHAPHMPLDWLQTSSTRSGWGEREGSYRKSLRRRRQTLWGPISLTSQADFECVASAGCLCDCVRVLCVCVCYVRVHSMCVCVSVFELQMTSERRQLCPCSSSYSGQIRRKILDCPPHHLAPYLTLCSTPYLTPFISPPLPLVPSSLGCTFSCLVWHSKDLPAFLEQCLECSVRWSVRNATPPCFIHVQAPPLCPSTADA